jgi:hypothetical protein
VSASSVSGRFWSDTSSSERAATSLQGRLNAEHAGLVLKFQPYEIPSLIHSRLLKPLGKKHSL